MPTYTVQVPNANKPVTFTDATGVSFVRNPIIPTPQPFFTFTGDGYITIPYIPAYNENGAIGGRIEVTVQVTDLSSNRIVLDDQTNDFRIQYNFANNQWRSRTFNSANAIRSDFTDTNEHTHVLTWDTGNNGEYLIDGVSIPGTQGSNVLTSPIIFGANAGLLQNIIGIIKNIRFYDAKVGGNAIHEWLINDNSNTLTDTGTIGGADGTLTPGTGAWTVPAIGDEVATGVVHDALMVSPATDILYNMNWVNPEIAGDVTVWSLDATTNYRDPSFVGKELVPSPTFADFAAINPAWNSLTDAYPTNWSARGVHDVNNFVELTPQGMRVVSNGSDVGLNLANPPELMLEQEYTVEYEVAQKVSGDWRVDNALAIVVLNAPVGNRTKTVTPVLVDGTISLRRNGGVTDNTINYFSLKETNKLLEPQSLTLANCLDFPTVVAHFFAMEEIIDTGGGNLTLKDSVTRQEVNMDFRIGTDIIATGTAPFSIKARVNSPANAFNYTAPPAGYSRIIIAVAKVDKDVPSDLTGGLVAFSSYPGVRARSLRVRSFGFEDAERRNWYTGRFCRGAQRDHGITYLYAGVDRYGDKIEHYSWDDVDSSMVLAGQHDISDARAQFAMNEERDAYILNDATEFLVSHGSTKDDPTAPNGLEYPNAVSTDCGNLLADTDTGVSDYFGIAICYFKNLPSQSQLILDLDFIRTNWEAGNKIFPPSWYNL